MAPMSEKNSDTSKRQQAGEPDLGRRRLFKAAVKGAAVGAPLIVTLRGGNAWAASCAAATTTTTTTTVPGGAAPLAVSSCVTSFAV